MIYRIEKDETSFWEIIYHDIKYNLINTKKEISDEVHTEIWLDDDIVIKMILFSAFKQSKCFRASQPVAVTFIFHTIKVLQIKINFCFAVLEEIPSKKFALEPVEKSTIIITTKIGAKRVLQKPTENKNIPEN